MNIGYPQISLKKLVGKQKERDHLKDLDVHRNIILNCILKIQKCEGVNRIRLAQESGSMGCFLKIASEPSKSTKRVLLLTS
jgi:hypothetical protein